MAFPYSGGRCSGICPDIGYTLIEKRCHGIIIFYAECSFKCLKCEIEQNNCSVCRGDRLPDLLCACKAGYYDDGFHDACQGSLCN
jgi:hypothetical protein